MNSAKPATGHCMRREIAEQPAVIAATMEGRLEDGRVKMRPGELDAVRMRTINRVVLLGMGSSLNAGTLGALYVERLARQPAVAVDASEFVVNSRIIDAHTLTVCITQSGESSDTLNAMAAAREQGACVVAVVANERSSASRLADHVLLINSGREQAVPATKTVSSTAVTLLQLAAWLGDIRGELPAEQHTELVNNLNQLPAKFEAALNLNSGVEGVAERLAHGHRSLYLASGFQLPIAREGALKMKETAYRSAEAFAVGEFQHGIMALVEQESTIVAIANRDERLLKAVAAAKASGARAVMVAEQGDQSVAEVADEVLGLPRTLPLLAPIVALAPLQLLAYHTTVALGFNPDSPRNLVKTVVD